MISKDEVKNIAKLARLELTEAEISKMQKDLSGILNYFNLLKKVPKLKVQKKTKVSNEFLQANRRLRKDETNEHSSSLANNLVQAAPDKQDGYIKVKSIL